MNIKIYKSIFQPSKKSALSIYIGPESIEIIYLKKGIKGITVEKSFYKQIQKKDITSTIIQDILKSEAIRETSVTTTLPEESIMLRRFTMPFIPPRDRPTAIRFEAKRHIPFNIDEIISNYYVIKENKAKNQMEILFIAAKKEDVNSTMLLMKDAGLTIEKIIPISLALINTLNITGSLEQYHPPTAILHFSSKTTAHIVITENGIPYIKREISFSGKEKPEDNLLNEVKLSSNYYKRECPEKNISKLIVCGLTEKPAWIDSVKNSLNMPVEFSTPLKRLNGSDIPAPQMEISIGLAGQILIKPKIDLNLLPEDAIPVKLNIKLAAATATIIAICFLGALYASNIPSISKLKKEIAIAETKKITVPGPELSSKSIEELNMLKTTWQQKRDILFTYTKNRINWNEKLKNLIKIMPKESWITQLTLGDSGAIPGARILILKGSTYAPDPNMEIEITNNFSNNLKKDPIFMAGFKRLTLGTISKTKVESYEVANFDISLTTD